MIDVKSTQLITEFVQIVAAVGLLIFVSVSQSSFLNQQGTFPEPFTLRIALPPTSSAVDDCLWSSSAAEDERNCSSYSSSKRKLLVAREAQGPLKELHIGGLFPMEAGSGGWPGGQAALPSALMALEDVNSATSGLLPGYALRLHHHNSKCLPGLAARQLYELLYQPPVKHVLMAGCSPVTTLIAETAHVWNLVVLSYGASSPALSDRDRFPTLFRTHPSANMQNPTRVFLFERFKWKRIAILQSVEEVFSSTARDLEEQCRARGIRVHRESFYGDPTDALKALRRQDARIVVGLFYATEARRVLCQAYHLRLYGRRHVWFLIGWYADTWFVPVREEGLNCTRAQMEEAVQYHFTTESIMLSRDRRPTISGMTGQKFLERLRRMVDTDPADTGGWPEAPLAYDAIWALALMLNCTQNSLPRGILLEHFAYNNSLMAERMFQCIRDVEFRGVSGRVKFSDTGDRIARTQIEQLQDGKYVLLGYFDASTQKLEWSDREHFFGDRGPPPDSTRIKRSPITTSLNLYIAVMVFVALTVVLIVALLLFQRRYAHRLTFGQSQSHCNSIFLIGCAVSALSLTLIGVPTASTSLGRSLIRLPTSPTLFSLFCHLRVSWLILGFQLAYGALFAKVWVAYQCNATQQKNRLLAAAAAANNGNNNNEETTSGGANSQSPWESIRVMLATMVGRQPTLAFTLRKLSSHAYDSLTSSAGGGTAENTAKRSSIHINPLTQPIPSSRFCCVVGTLCMFDATLLLVWLAVDPMQRTEIRFNLQEPPSASRLEDVMLQPVLELCQSANNEIWTGVLLGYKALLLLFGMLLGWETRRVKPRFINDLRSVLLSLCNVSVLALLTGPIVALFLRSNANAFFGFVSATVLLCTVVSVAVIFLPKVLYIHRFPQPTKEELEAKEHQLLCSGRLDYVRYQQLLMENVELKRQIEIRNIRIAECRRILAGHHSSGGSGGSSSKSPSQIGRVIASPEISSMSNVCFFGNHQPPQKKISGPTLGVGLVCGGGGGFVEPEPVTASTTTANNDGNTLTTVVELNSSNCHEQKQTDEPPHLLPLPPSPLIKEEGEIDTHFDLASTNEEYTASLFKEDFDQSGQDLGVQVRRLLNNDALEAKKGVASSADSQSFSSSDEIFV